MVCLVLFAIICGVFGFVCEDLWFVWFCLRGFVVCLVLFARICGLFGFVCENLWFVWCCLREFVVCLVLFTRICGLFGFVCDNLWFLLVLLSRLCGLFGSFLNLCSCFCCLFRPVVFVCLCGSFCLFCLGVENDGKRHPSYPGPLDFSFGGCFLLSH